jgi:SAM-dependent methyltransferase
MGERVRAFYDDLAESYHLIFADWRASVERQGGVLDRLLRAALGHGPFAILDCACGIGTQTLGLARHGHRVHGTDLSPVAVARAEREAAALGVRATFGVADLRDLPNRVPGTFDAVIACDYALPHLLDDADLRAATAGMAAKLRPGGGLLATIRDYDRLVQERPRAESPRVIDDAAGRRIAFQVWDWTADASGYRLHQFLLRQDGVGWRVERFAADYRALLRADLDAALASAGLVDVRWLEPAESGFYQPVVTARAP